MSNYLQSKWKLLYPYLYFSLAICPALATHPQDNAIDHQTDTINIQAQSGKSDWTEAHKQLERLYQSVSTNKDIVKAEHAAASKANDIRQSVVNKATNIAKGFVYDPEHPDRLFDQLITGYTFLTSLEKQFIPYGEKILGVKNQLVITGKEKYAEQLQYLDALKRQKQQLMQMQPPQKSKP